MEFLEHPGLSRLSALLKDLDVGDRILSGRLELFSTNEQDFAEENPTVPSPCEMLKNEMQNIKEQSQEKETPTERRSSIEQEASNIDLHQEQLQDSLLQGLPDSVKATGVLTSSDSDCSNTSKNELLGVPGVLSEKRARSCEFSDIPGQSSFKRRKNSSSSRKLLGTHSFAEARRLLVHLVNTMNACFPDYDFRYISVGELVSLFLIYLFSFSSVTPEAFEHVENFVDVYITINYHLSFLVERIVPGFLQDLWASIKDSINIRNASIYSYTSHGGEVESDHHVDDELCLFSFDYFFVDESSNKILFFSCMTKRWVRLIGSFC